jgi:hypothetical protein
MSEGRSSEELPFSKGMLVIGYMKFRDTKKMRDVLEKVWEALGISPSRSAFFEEIVDGNIYRFKYLDWGVNFDENTVRGIAKDLGEHMESFELSLYYVEHSLTIHKLAVH